MNTKSKIMLAFIISSVVVVIGITIYLAYDITHNFKPKEADDEPATEQNTHTQTSTDSIPEASDDYVSSYIPPSTEYAEDSHKYIFVGDSRYVAMEHLKTENDTFICDNGVGRYFLQENMDRIISAAQDENSRIVIGLGVNDVNSPAEYITMLKELRSKTEAEIFYVLVNPVDERLCRASGYSITNKVIDSFNVEVTNGVVNDGINIIDVNSFLKDAGYSCTDGLHYTEETYGTIFHYLKTSLSHY